MSMNEHIQIEKFFRDTGWVVCRSNNQHKNYIEFIKKSNYKKNKMMWMFIHKYVNILNNCGKYHE